MADPPDRPLSADELRDEMQDIAELLIATRNTWYDHVSHPDAWVGAPGSPCRDDVAAGETGPGGPWDEKPFRWVTEISGHYLSAAAEHLKNLGLMFQAGAFFLSPELLVRAVIENCMRAVWILDNQVSPRSRAARVFLDSFVSLGHSLEGFQKLAPDIGKELKANRKKLRKVDLPKLFEATEISLNEPPDEQGWSIAGETYPSPEAVAALLADRSEITERDAQGIYANLSGYIHPNAVMLSLRLTPVTYQGRAGRGFGVSSKYLRSLIGPAIVSFYEGYRLQMTYLGWEPQIFEKWVDHAARCLPDEFGTPSTHN